MILSRVILAVLMLIVGGMVFGVDRGVDRLSRDMAKMETRMTAIETRIDTISFLSDLRLQRVTGWIGRPRVPPVRHIYKKAPDPLSPRP